MTRKFGSRRIGNTTIKTLEKQPIKFAHAICPLNLEEQKERFLKHGKLPKFILKGSEDEIEDLFNKARNQIRFDLFGEAEYILKSVKEKYGDGENYLDAQFGNKITKEEATHILEQYLKENNLDGAMSIVWCADLASSARMMWIGPHCKHNKPEARSYSFWIKNSPDNNFLREQGIRCLADHEIGTHFLRSYNECFQPWDNDRRRFHLRDRNSIEGLSSEEGLAAIHTIFHAKVRYLWLPALQYYTACKAAEMTFKQLFDHLTMYVKSPDHRWRLCMRVKRGLLDPNDLGGYGKDQCYFEGAVEILRSLDMIDFSVMMSGKICVDEVQRCKRLARLDCLKLPAFMKNENRYKKHLKAIAHLNGLDLEHQKKNAPAAYIRRLRQGRRIGNDKVRRIHKRRFKGMKRGSPLGSQSTESTASEYEEYASPESGEGGGSYTPVYKFDQKDPRVDSGISSGIQSNANDIIETIDTLSLHSVDSASIKSFTSAKSDCKSVKSELSWKTVKTSTNEKSGRHGSSTRYSPSLKNEKSGRSSNSPGSARSLRLDCLSRASNSSQKPALYSSLKSSSPVIINENTQKMSSKGDMKLLDIHSRNNNNTAPAPIRKDLLPPITSPRVEQLIASTDENLCFNRKPLPSALHHNVCTVVSDEKTEENNLKDEYLCINEKGDNQRREVNQHDCHLIGLSTLTNSAVNRTKSKSANQNSVFHPDPSGDQIGKCQNVYEFGPEKFIYPDLRSDFETNLLNFPKTLFFPSKIPPENASNHIPKRRAKSACVRTTRTF